MPEVSVWAPNAARVRVAIAEPGEPLTDRSPAGGRAVPG